MQIRWEGDGVNEVGYWTNPQPVIAGAKDVIAGAKDVIAGSDPQSMSSEIPVIRIDPRYFRPTEVETLLGDPSKAKEKLGWVPEITLDEMVQEMVAVDLAEAKKFALLKLHGFDTAFVSE
jgi:GDPmannose 4,6-dehydratase